ncbi:MAG: hypothetical protein A2Y24_00210 [Clostridiales bacterium GWE2_32_10]|nr:MAG: hypothetical protein A2Y24_00210 [Clostridiales bacterium GWE2_32_10]HBY20223.1 hypothetical protein [Clostridiales bacterium]
MKVFIAGARAISNLNDDIKNRLRTIYIKKITVLIGDANGVDKAVQKFFYDVRYKDVIVYAMEGRTRNNIGNWNVENVELDGKKTGFEYYATKDLKMAEDADYGFMIWNGKSKGTLNNIINMVELNKKTLVYFMPKNQYYCINDKEDFKKLINICDKEVGLLAEKLLNRSLQMMLFN